VLKVNVVNEAMKVRLENAVREDLQVLEVNEVIREILDQWVQQVLEAQQVW
jgi:hypothetical protein